MSQRPPNTVAQLTPQSAEGVIHFAQITDTHLFLNPTQQFAYLNPEQTLLSVLAELEQQPQLDFLLHTGDLAQEAHSDTYARYLAHVARLPYPNFRVAGNHDAPDVFPFHAPPEMPSIVHIGAWSIILLHTPVAEKIYGHLSDSQLLGLAQLLKQFPEQHILLACHHHPFAMASAWLDQHILKNTPDLLDILRQHSQVKACIYGHVHQESAQVWKGIQFISCPSTCLQFKPKHDEFSLDHLAPGYRLFQLYPDGTLSTQVQRIALQLDQVDLNFTGY